MESVKEYLISIGEFFSSIYDFTISFFEDIVYVIKLTGEFVAKIPEYFAWLPDSVLALVVALFGIVVIYKVLGREG